MTSFLNKIRTPLPAPLSKKIIYSALTLLLGIALGVIAKFLDETPSNLLPPFLEALDLRNFFSRMGIWIFLAVVISIFSKSPCWAAMNVFLFFMGMVGSYYLYTVFIAGFFPKSYMLTWIVMTAISPFIAFVCWYARGNGTISIVIASLIVAFTTRQAFSFGFWYIDVTDVLEFILWVITFVVLYQTPKQLLKVFLLGMVITLMLSPFHLVFGML